MTDPFSRTSQQSDQNRFDLPNFRPGQSIFLTLMLGLMILANSVVAQVNRGNATLLVMPFENRSKAAGADWLSEACSEVLVQRMASPGLYVVNRNQRVYSFDHAGVPVTVKPFTSAPAVIRTPS